MWSLDNTECAILIMHSVLSWQSTTCCSGRKHVICVYFSLISVVVDFPPAVDMATRVDLPPPVGVPPLVGLPPLVDNTPTIKPKPQNINPKPQHINMLKSIRIEHDGIECPYVMSRRSMTLNSVESITY